MFASLLLNTGHPGGPWGSGLGFLFFLIPLFWFGIILVAAILLGRRWRRAGAPGHAPWMQGARSAETTLAERFAQGEIDESDYRSRLGVLRSAGAAERPRK
jgi:putative membrane protein